MSRMSHISARRLYNQLLAGSGANTPHDVVARLTAVQSQDYLGALWAVGQRMHDPDEKVIERALADRSIVRTWPMRGTLHFMAAEDVRWILGLLGARMLPRHAARLERDFGITTAVLRRSRVAVKESLQGGTQLSRPELYARLEKERIAKSADVGLHIVWHLAHEGLICFGPRRGKQQTFVLLDEWLPAREPMSEDDALSELARRYFIGHGPATFADFVWWSGLPATLAKKGLESAAPHLAHEEIDGKTYWFLPPGKERASAAKVHLLPPFDEFTVGYRDRTDVRDPMCANHLDAGFGMLQAVIVVNGMVSGTWKRVLNRNHVHITASLFRPLKRNEKRDLEEACERYRQFIGAADVQITT
jgi:hypothetical protein